MSNQQWVLNSRPDPHLCKENFRLEEIPVASDKDLKEDEVLLEALFISVDPYMRGRFNAQRNYFDRFEIDQPFTGNVVARVVASTSPKFQAGDIVHAFLPWKRFQVAPADRPGLNPVLKNGEPGPSPSTFLGVLGLTGLSAYIPIMEIGKPNPGDTVYVSGSAGAVGSIAGQIYKLLGCTVIGSAGSDEKVEYVKSLGFDHVFNYKTTPDFESKLRELAPEGIHIYFDNVGGPMLDATLPNMRLHGKVLMCGSISQYDVDKEHAYGVKNIFHITTKRLTVQGFIVSDWASKFTQGIVQLRQWLEEGKIRARETVVHGFDKVPEAMIGLLRGDNIGKMVVQV